MRHRYHWHLDQRQVRFQIRDGMHRIDLSNFRCFYSEQNARLAPLTLLVGENSTGKSSFLALIRIMWHLLKRRRMPNFNDPIFPLGGFDEIVSNYPKEKNRGKAFEAKIHIEATKKNLKSCSICLEVEFSEYQSGPRPTEFRIINTENNIKIVMKYANNDKILASVSIGYNKTSIEFQFVDRNDLIQEFYFCLKLIRKALKSKHDRSSVEQLLQERYDYLKISELDENEIELLCTLIDSLNYWQIKDSQLSELNAIAPIRSQPMRTYEQTGNIRDHEGAYIPEYLANVYRQNKRSWKLLRQKLEKFGNDSGMFDKIGVEFLRRNNQGPFQVQFQKPEDGIGEQPSNIIDMGYGVNQILPILTELSAGESKGLFLLQQPEVHLHPRAQAELGSLFCRAASEGKMLVVETHSDYLLDRIRIDMRDGQSKIAHDMISILFFERKSSGVEISSLKLDENGNIINAPHGYRDFFMEEKRRVLGL